MFLRYLEHIVVDLNLSNILTTRSRLLAHVNPPHYFVFNAILNISLFLGNIISKFLEQKEWLQYKLLETIVEFE